MHPCVLSGSAVDRHTAQQMIKVKQDMDLM